VWGGSAGFVLDGDASWMSFVANDTRLVVKKESAGVEFYDPKGDVVSTVSRDAVMSLTPTFAVITSSNQDRVGLWDSDQGVIDLWSISGERSERRLDIRSKAFPVINESGAVFSFESNDKGISAWNWPADSIRPVTLGIADKTYFSLFRDMPRVFGLGKAIGSFNGGNVFLHNLSRWGEKPTVLGRHDHEVLWGAANRQGNLVATADETGVVKIWRASAPGAAPLRILHGPRRVRSISFDASSSRLAIAGTAENASWMWDLDGPPTATPWIFGGGDDRSVKRAMLSESGRWLVSSSPEIGAGFLWPIDVGRPYVLAETVDVVGPAVFLLDGSHLVAGLRDGSVRAWPLKSKYGLEPSVLLQPRNGIATSLAVQPTGAHILATGTVGAWLIPTGGGTPKQLKPPSSDISGAAFSADGRFAAAVTAEGSSKSSEHWIWIWNLETGESRALGPMRHQSKSTWQVSFAPDGRHLYTNSLGGLTVWDLKDGSLRTISNGGVAFSISPDGQRIYIAGSTLTHKESLRVYDVGSGEMTSIESHIQATSIAVGPKGETLVTGGRNGSIRVGPANGSEPRVLLGHQTAVWVSVSPDGRWIASTDFAGSIRLWPMPDLSKPPLHTLPHDELIAKLKTLTNLRVVRDGDSATGWKLEVGPFPGWETVPSW
jgi:WD40 repeat protein